MALCDLCDTRSSGFNLESSTFEPQSSRSPGLEECDTFAFFMPYMSSQSLYDTMAIAGLMSNALCFQIELLLQPRILPQSFPISTPKLSSPCSALSITPISSAYDMTL